MKIKCKFKFPTYYYLSATEIFKDFHKFSMMNI